LDDALMAVEADTEELVVLTDTGGAIERRRRPLWPFGRDLWIARWPLRKHVAALHRTRFTAAIDEALTRIVRGRDAQILALEAMIAWASSAADRAVEQLSVEQGAALTVDAEGLEARAAAGRRLADQLLDRERQ